MMQSSHAVTRSYHVNEGVADLHFRSWNLSALVRATKTCMNNYCSHARMLQITLWQCKLMRNAVTSLQHVANTNLFLFSVQPESNPATRTVLFASNRGRVGALFDNRYHAEQLQQWRMSKTHAWTCAFNYLFPIPVPGVSHRFQTEIAALSAPEPLKIGVMIRTGDTDWDVDSYNLDFAAKYFDCAEAIEQTHLHPSSSQAAIWYLASDHKGLRAAALKKVRLCVVDGMMTVPFLLTCVFVYPLACVCSYLNSSAGCAPEQCCASCVRSGVPKL